MANREDIKARNELIVKLSLAGFSTSSIARHVNDTGKVTKNWEPVSLRTVQRTIAEFFQDNQPDPTDNIDQDGFMRLSLLMQMQLDIEKLSLYIANKDKDKMGPDPKNPGRQIVIKKGTPWKPFEYAKSIETLHKMRADYARINNWDYGSSKNPPTTSPFNSLNYKKAELSFLRAKPDALLQLSDDIKAATLALGEGAQQKYMDGEDDVVYSELQEDINTDTHEPEPEPEPVENSTPPPVSEESAIEIEEPPKDGNGSILEGL